MSLNPAAARLTSENRATIARITCNRQREGLALAQLRQFLRDVHCPCVARRPGIWDYRTQWLDPIDAGLFAAVPGIECDEPAGLQLQFMSDVRWIDAAALDQFERSPDAAIRALILADVAMVVGEGTTYEWRGDRGGTLVDRGADPVPSGPVRTPAYAIFLRSAGDPGAFEAGVDALARCWAALPGTARLRFSLLAPPASPPPANAAVPRHPHERQHQAMIEVQCADHDAVARLARVPLLADCARWARALHAYPVTHQFDWTREGRPTLAALRGFHAAEAIDGLGAVQHRDPALLEWMYGPVAAAAPVA